ncbi:MAG TPA: hypothetical protein DCL38_10510 [Lachnospiraceae bacterium]|nr:hypothetical protein [Lachnospiraceae bacterium]
MRVFFRKKGHRVIYTAAAFLAVLSVTGCNKEKIPEDELSPSITETAISVTEELPAVKTLSTESYFIGTYEADSTVTIIPRVSAEVLSVNFEVGDHVDAGELLFTLDDSSARIALDQANAGLKSAEAGLDAAKANYEAGQASYIAQEASNTATHFAAAETLGKIDTTGQQLQVAADSAYVQARQAGLSSDSAHVTYDFYKDQIRAAEDKREGLTAAESSAKQALDSAQSGLSAAANAVTSLSKIKEQYETIPATDSGMTQEEFLKTVGFNSVEELDAAIIEAQGSLTQAQKQVNTASSAYSSAQSALVSLEGTIDQLYMQKDTAGNTAESASLSYSLAGESAELARRQKSDFDTYTRNTITSQALAQVIGSDQQLAAGGAQVRASGAQVNVTSAGVDQAKASVENAKTALSYYSVSSPVSGTITEINISEHNMAGPGQTAYTIKGDAPGKIVFYVAEKTAKEMKQGDAVTLEKDGEEFAGSITLISDEVDTSTGLYKVEAQAADPGLSLPFDSSVKLRAASRKAADVLTVPVDSVYYDNDQAFVYINDHGTAVRRDVTTGLSEGGFIEIKTGIVSGEYVITSWNARLKDGSRVIAEHDVGKKEGNDIVVVID